MKERGKEKRERGKERERDVEGRVVGKEKREHEKVDSKKSGRPLTSDQH
jgi:hypothetical protein